MYISPLSTSTLDKVPTSVPVATFSVIPVELNHISVGALYCGAVVYPISSPSRIGFVVPFDCKNTFTYKLPEALTNVRMSVFISLALFA